MSFGKQLSFSSPPVLFIRLFMTNSAPLLKDKFNQRETGLVVFTYLPKKVRKSASGASRRNGALQHFLT